MICPHCNEEIPDAEIARHMGAKGGKKSKRKMTLTTEEARALAARRWTARREGQ